MSASGFAFTADLHLQPNAWANRPEIRGDAYESLRQIVDYCITHDLCLLIGGDAFDRRRPDSESLVASYIREMKRMADACLNVFYIQGDHDFAEVPWLAAAAPWATHLHGISFTIGGYRIRGIDWTPKERLAEELAKLTPDDRIVMMHQRWDELQGIGSTDGSVSQIPYAHVLLTGDYHGHRYPEMIRGEPRNAQGEPLKIYSPGSTCMQAIDEQPEKFFFVFDEHLGCTSIPLLTRNCRSYRLESPEHLDNMVRYLEGDFLSEITIASWLNPREWKPLLRIQYRDDIPNAYTRLLQAAGNKCHLFLDPQRVVQEIVINEQAAPEGAFDTLVTAVDQLAANDEDVRTGVRRLLESKDQPVELGTMREEFFAKT